jgi:hypothetical protein
MKPKKSAVIRARCDEGMKRSVEELAVLKELDPADIIRMAVRSYIRHFISGTSDHG